jgi:HK97 family phage portal protein
VSIGTNQYKEKSGYIYKRDQSVPEVRYPINLLGESNICHIKEWHPLDDYRGLSMAASATYSINQHNEAGQWNQALLKNAARPSGALKFEGEGELSEAQYDILKQSVDEQYTGTSNAGRPMLLPGDLSWVPMSLSPADMDFAEMKNSTARDICLAYGVPPQLLGIPGDNTYSNLQEARLALWEQTVLPAVDLLLENLNMWLVPRYGKSNLRLEYDKDSIEALSVRRKEKAAMLSSMAYISDAAKRDEMGYSDDDAPADTTEADIAALAKLYEGDIGTL